MTKYQYKVYRYIIKHSRLSDVCNRFNVDYRELQSRLDKNALLFSDSEMDDKTEIRLKDFVLEQVEQRRESIVDRNITRGLAIFGAVTGSISICLDIVLPLL